MAGVRIRAVACHNNWNLAVSEAGQVFSWGLRLQPSLEGNISWSKQQPLVPTVMQELRNHRVRQVIAGECHCAVLTEDGALFTWETARDLQSVTGEPLPELGYGSFVHDLGVPHRVLALEGVRIASVAVGVGFTVAVTEAGAVYSFGVADGRLGHGHEGRDEDEDVFLPRRIEALDGIHIRTVAAGKHHTLALTWCGKVYTWGAIDRDSPLHDLGSESNGGGDGDNRNDEHFFNPQLVTALVGVRAIAAGPCMSCAVTVAGALYTLGDNEHGNLGHGDVRSRNRPTLVQGLQGICIVAVSIDLWHTLVLAADGSVYSFRKGLGLGISGEGGEVLSSAHTPQEFPGLVCMVPR
jgi:alpha-tubulin suppressor-like RCC1 family protein